VSVVGNEDLGTSEVVGNIGFRRGEIVGKEEIEGNEDLGTEEIVGNG
jgi:hypothetical protein